MIWTPLFLPPVWQFHSFPIGLCRPRALDQWLVRYCSALWHLRCEVLYQNITEKWECSDSLRAAGLCQVCGGIWAPGAWPGHQRWESSSSFQVQPEQLPSSLSYLLGICVRFVLESIFNTTAQGSKVLVVKTVFCFVLFYSPRTGTWPVSALRVNAPFCPHPVLWNACLPPLSILVCILL